MRVLITGASSFIGQHVTLSAVNAGISVIGTYRNRNEAIHALNSPPDAPELVQLDICDPDSFEKLSGRIDAIIHIAAISDYIGASNDTLIQTNIIGTNNVLKYALKKGIHRIIYTSSMSVYGQISTDSIDTNTEISNPDVYGTTKYAGERLLASAERDVSSVSLRLPGVLGRGASRSFIPSVCQKLLFDQPVTIFNEKAFFNNVVYINDLCRFIFQIIDNSSWNGFHAFPIGGDNAIQMLELIKEMKSLLCSSSEIIKINSNKQSFVIDSKYASTKFGYNPRSTLDSISEYCRDIIGLSN